MTVQDSPEIIQDIVEIYRQEERASTRELIAENNRLLREIELLREIKRLNDEVSMLRSALSALQEGGEL